MRGTFEVAHMDKGEQEIKRAAVKRALEILGEHFDNVQVLVNTLDDDGCTFSIAEGRGNWYARVYQARLMSVQDDATAHFEEMPKPPGEPGDSWKDEKN